MSIYKNLKNLYRSQKNSYAVYLSVVFCVVIYIMDVLTIKKRLLVFLSSAGISLTKLSLAMKN